MFSAPEKCTANFFTVTYNEVREPSVLLQQKKRTILINVLKVENFYINKGIMVMIGSIQRLSAKNLGINF